MHNYFNEIIDKLVESGMEELSAIALVTKMMEEEADEFIYWRDYYDAEKCNSQFVS